MEGIIENSIASSRRVPWNKGKLTGAKPPLRPKHVWSIRSKLQIENRVRDLAMFNLAIDSKLRGCDVGSLKVEDVAPHGHAVDRATVPQTPRARKSYSAGVDLTARPAPLRMSSDTVHSQRERDEQSS
jgi:hypothetical protein